MKDVLALSLVFFNQPATSMFVTSDAISFKLKYPNLADLLEYYIPETDASQYLSYGCNCNLLDSKGLATPGHGAAVDQIDQACKNYKDCQRCVQIEDGSECNLEGPSALYKLGFLSDQPYCMNPVKSCNRHLCECDKQFAEELKQALPFYDSQFSTENHDRSTCQHKPKLSFNSSPRMRPIGVAGDGFNFIGGEKASAEMFLHDDDAKCCGPSTGPKKIYHDAVKQCCNPTKKEYFLANIGECPPDWNL